MTIGHRLPAMLALALLPTLASCAANETAPLGQPVRPSIAPTSSSAPTGEAQESLSARGQAITLTINREVITGTLNDTPAAAELAAQLPITLTFDDFNRVEKISTLASPLSMNGMPEGDDPEIGDIGFWAPGGDLVLYYGNVGYYNGIARLGTFDNVDAIATRTGPFTLTVDRA